MEIISHAVWLYFHFCLSFHDGKQQNPGLVHETGAFAREMLAESSLTKAWEASARVPGAQQPTRKPWFAIVRAAVVAIVLAGIGLYYYFIVRVGKFEREQKLVRSYHEDEEQIVFVRDTFNALFKAWNEAPTSETGEKALANAKVILGQLRPYNLLDGGAVFEALDKEIQQAEPGSRQMTKVAATFSAH